MKRVPRLERKLVWLLVILLVSASAGIILAKYVWHATALKDVGVEVPVLLLTLAPLIIYMHDTHRIADWTCAPAARFDMEQPNPEEHPLLLNTFPVNLCDLPLKLYCNVSARVAGEFVQLDKFYGGAFPWHLAPRGSYRGVINLQDVFRKAGTSFEELDQQARNLGPGQEANDLVVITYYYEYETMDGAYRSDRFYQGHYYNLPRQRLVLDVHPRHQPGYSEPERD